MPREEEETIEIDPHVYDKARREKRIKGKRQDKAKEQWVDGKGKKPKKYKKNRRQDKAALRDLARSYG